MDPWGAGFVGFVLGCVLVALKWSWDVSKQEQRRIEDEWRSELASIKRTADLAYECLYDHPNGAASRLRVLEAAVFPPKRRKSDKK